MVNNKKYILLFLIIHIPFIIFGVESIPLKISLIPSNISADLVELKKGDLKLFINNVERDILELSKEVNSISKKSILGRNFILSFDMTDYGQRLVQGITCFVNEILYPGDILLLISPKSVYQIKVIIKKEQMIKTILTLVKRDCFVYKKNRSASEKNLEKILKRMDNIIEDRIPIREGDLYSVYNLDKKTAIHQFLSNYTREFLNFKNQFLLPDMGKFYRLLDILDTREGEKWWIHFQQRDIYPSLSILKQMINKIRSYLSSMVTGEDLVWASSLSTRISQLEKQLFLADQYPIEKYLQIIMKGNIYYNVLFFQNLRQNEKETVTHFVPDLEAILKKLVNHSGGKAIISNDLKSGMRELKNHSICFYNLFWSFNGIMENKEIKLIAEDSKINLDYRKKFSESEIKTLYHFISEKKVRIENVLIVPRSLKFSIVHFKLDTKKKYGILRVEINLFNKEDKNVYKSENSLRGNKDKIDISLPIPKFKPGFYRLNIRVYDRMANTQNTVIREIQMD